MFKISGLLSLKCNFRNYLLDLRLYLLKLDLHENRLQNKSHILLSFKRLSKRSEYLFYNVVLKSTYIEISFLALHLEVHLHDSKQSFVHDSFAPYD